MAPFRANAPDSTQPDPGARQRHFCIDLSEELRPLLLR
eukprot:CAMPEP_0119540586 /NCGR_PEP_ID=MMETSP1344-20130328/52428_1 /TAXON_ID=236787 /ORGANISM="Florenciella parvula, Strain CCMP2471" /LENGTH=37 /DNA_ID= /DNA_START= /DNA_END= /DNA_ORIENTATION=